MKKRWFTVLVIFAIVAAFFVGFILKLKNNNEILAENQNQLPHPIAIEDIIGAKASKVVYERNANNQVIAKFVDINLNSEEIGELVDGYNKVPQYAKNVTSVDGNIAIGVVLILNNKSEIRLDYNKYDIYITNVNTNATVMYKVNSGILNGLFNELLNK